MPLLNLPHEVLNIILRDVLIIGYSENDVRPGFLVSPTDLNLVCRFLRTVVERLQYKHIIWDIERRSNIVPLIRTLRARPELGQLVACIQILGTWPKNEARTDLIELGIANQAEIAEWTQFCQGCQSQLPNLRVEKDLGSFGSWSDELKQGNSNSYMALLLLSTPNLRNLVPGLGLSSLMPERGERLTEPLSTKHSGPSVHEVIKRLTKLESLDFGAMETLSQDEYHTPLHMIDSTDVETVFSLPRLSWACVHITDSSRRPLIIPQISMLNLNKFRVNVMFTGTNLLDPLLQLAPNLEELEIRMCICDEAVPQERNWLDCRQLSTALSNSPYAHVDGSRSKLKRLFITADSTSGSDGGLWQHGQMKQWGVKRSLGSLQFLGGLECLYVEAGCLLGWHAGEDVILQEVLPASLKTLFLDFNTDINTHALRGVRRWSVDKLKEYFEYYPHSLQASNLEEIFIVEGRSDRFIMKYAPEFRELRAILKRF